MSVLGTTKHSSCNQCVSECIVFRAMILLWSQLSKVLKLVRWACSVPGEADIRGHEAPHHLQRPFSPSVPAEAGCLLLRPVFISGENLHCLLQCMLC